MRNYVVTCDRCGETIPYNEINDKIIDGDTFMIPTISSTGGIINNGKQIDLCKSCIYYLSRFIEAQI